MTAFFLKLIESVSYAATRGAVKAVLEWYNQPRTATDEEVTNEDSIRERRLRARLDMWLLAEDDDHSGPDEAAPVEPTSKGPRLGSEGQDDETIGLA